jgi:hypothetical protein
VKKRRVEVLSIFYFKIYCRTIGVKNIALTRIQANSSMEKYRE